MQPSSLMYWAQDLSWPYQQIHNCSSTAAGPMRVWVVLLWWCACTYASVLSAASSKPVGDPIQGRTGNVHAQRLHDGNGSPARRLLQQQPAQQAGESGAVVVWGDSSSVGPTPVSQLSAGIVKVSASFGLALALTDKGEVVAWSDGNGIDQTDVPAAAQGHVVDIAASIYWGMALLSNGSVVAWGYDSDKQTVVPDALRPGGTAKAVSLAAGYKHALALLANGSVIAWGSNLIGQSSIPAAARANVTAIAAFSSSSAAVLSDGTLVGWGNFDNIPSAVQQEGVTAISLAMDQAVAVLRNGSVYTWAYVPKITYPRALPQVLALPPVLLSSIVVAVSAGQNLSMALLGTGQVVAWGVAPAPYTITPVPDSVSANGIAISAGAGYAVAVIATPKSIPGQVNVSTSSPPPPEQVPSSVVSSSATDSKGSKLSVGALAGIIIGAVALVSLLVTGVILRGRRHASRKQTKDFTVEPSGPSSQALKGTAVWDQLVKMLRPTETFMKSVAHEYSWIIGAEQAGPMHNVEAGVNDTQLDKLQSQGQSMSPVVELSRSELCDQVHLLADGLLGKGATALVFKCVWPSRFGPNSLLAIKVLKDGMYASVNDLESFGFEAQLLAATRHHNVVRLYGYCLEPPTVCLILELLPTSLKQKLYGVPSIKPNLNTQSTAVPESRNTQYHTARPLSNTHQTASFATTTTQSHTASPDMQTDWNSISESRPGSAAETRSPPPSTRTESDMALTVSTGSAASSTIPPLSGNISPIQDSSLTAAPRMSLLEIVRTSTDIAAGLAYLHSQEEPVIPESEEAGMIKQVSSVKEKRIVHRDLKPANILLNSEGSAKITDFGLARDHEHTTVAAVNMGAGTMPYMAPEQLTAARAGLAALDATNFVDVYSNTQKCPTADSISYGAMLTCSLGMMMWEMLAGEMPWQGKSEDEIFALVVNHRRPPLPGEPSQDGQSLPHVPGLYDHPLLPQFTSIIRACWQQRDRKRPTAVKLHELLATLLSDLHSHQTPDSV